MFTKLSTAVLPAVFSLLFISTVLSCKEAEVEQPTIQPTSIGINGKEYPIRTIGSQIWTVANYDGAGGIAYKTGSEKPEYGRYYTFQEAQAIPVPAGWRLPTQQDYMELAQGQGVTFNSHRAMRQEAIKKLMSTTNWQPTPGTNASGFNGHPGGYSFQNSEPADGDIGEFWTADGATMSIQGGMDGAAPSIVFYKNTDSAEYRFNVRFIKNRL